MQVLVITMMLAFTAILFLINSFHLFTIDALESNLVASTVYATVAGPEYCPPSTYFDSELGDCLYRDGRGNNPDGSFCGLEGCYSPDGEFLYLSPFHPSNAAQRCTSEEYYNYELDECLDKVNKVESPEIRERLQSNGNGTKPLTGIIFPQIGFGSEDKPCPPGFLPDKSGYCESITGSFGSDTNEFRTYEDVTFGLKIEYPNNWILKIREGNSSTNSAAFYLTPITEQNSTEYLAHIYISARDTYNTALGDELIDITDTYKDFDGFKLHNSSTSETLSGFPAYSITYAHDVVNLDGSTSSGTTMHLGTIVNNKLYEIRFSSDTEDFDIYLPTVQRIIQSFEIKH